MNKHEDIEITEIVEFLFSKKKTLFILSVIGLLLGVFIALTTPKKYELTISFLNENRDPTGMGRSGIAGLAGLTGMSLSNISQTISPAVYPEILESATFVEKINEMEFSTVNGQKLSLYTYITEYNKTSLISKMLRIPSILRSAFSSAGDTIVKEDVLRREDWIFLDDVYVSVASHLKNSLEISNAGNGIIEISVIHQDPYIAGELAERAYNFLTAYIAEYELVKERRKLEHTEDQLEIVKGRFLEAQKKLATFQDRNVNIVSAQARSEEERLQADYRVAFNVYNTVMLQKEEALLKLKDNIPAFTIVEPVKIPKDPSTPNKKLIVIITVFVAVSCSILYFLIVFFLERLGIRYK